MRWRMTTQPNRRYTAPGWQRPPRKPSASEPGTAALRLESRRAGTSAQGYPEQIQAALGVSFAPLSKTIRVKLPGSFFKQDSPGPQYDLSYDFSALRSRASEHFPQYDKLGLVYPAGLGLTWNCLSHRHSFHRKFRWRVPVFKPESLFHILTYPRLHFQPTRV